jgi:Flp pilus assembly protein TadG
MKAMTRKHDRQRRLRTRLRAFCRNERATAILEFALISLPFFALLIAIIETALVFFAQQSLETVGEAASRLIMTGQAQTAGWSATQYKTQVCKSLPVFMSCTNLMVDVQTAAAFNAVSVGTPTITYKNGSPSNAWSYTTGTGGAIVIVRVMYLWPLATGPLGFSLDNQGSNHRLLISTSVAKSEPYAQ